MPDFAKPTIVVSKCLGFAACCWNGLVIATDPPERGGEHSAAWIVRYENAYLMAQTFFAPYPEELVKVADSGKGRGLG